MSGSDERSAKVVGLLLPRDGDERVLLARHTYGPPVWAMIGGMAKPGEAPDAAARREALEETGQTVSTDRLLAVCDRDELMLFVFEGRVLGGQLSAQAEEIAELRWFAPNELTTVPIYPVMTRLTAATAQPSTAGLVRIDQAWPDGPTTPVYICPVNRPGSGDCSRL